jgi:hypothetical protein
MPRKRNTKSPKWAIRRALRHEGLCGLKTRSEIPWLALLLIAFVAAAYGPALNMAFIGDDYVFLDKTRDTSFTELWSFKNVDFGWYRPWSRELHFWLLQRVAGFHEVAYRSLGAMLWVVALCLYAAILRRLASPRVALLATLGVASLALWGTPLLWISGSQDLWMLCFTMASAFLFVSGHIGWALLPFALALLSKETAAVLPALLCAYLVFLERRRLIDALRRTALIWVLVFVWLVVHPTLHTRLLSAPQITRELEHRPPPLGILVRATLSALNLDVLPRPQEVAWGDVLRVLASTLVLAAGAAFVVRGRPAVDPGGSPGAGKGTRARFALAWMAIGWFPLFLPSIGWHAYYGCLGALGAWLALAIWLQNRPGVALAAITCLGILRGAHASTISWDWGNEWYQRRAGNMLSGIRDGLLQLHPTLPLHSRVFLGHIPNNIGLIAGRSPAQRVWYRDSTLQADFFSHYRPRSESEAHGEDFFFRLDTLRGMVEVRAGPEDVRHGLLTNPDWEDDHERLAMLFLRSRDVQRAAVEFEKLSVLPHRADAAGYAAVCWEAVGDSARADSLIAVAGSRKGLTHAQLQDWLARLRESFPGR